jgi:hypothetical protein
MEDALEKLTAAGVDIAIMALICVSLFSGQPAFETSRAETSGAGTSRTMTDCPHAAARGP